MGNTCLSTEGSCEPEAQNSGLAFLDLPNLSRSFSNGSRKCVLLREMSQFLSDGDSLTIFKELHGSNSGRGLPSYLRVPSSEN